MSEENQNQNQNENENQNQNEKQNQKKKKKLPIDFKVLDFPLKTPKSLTSEKLADYFEEGFKYKELYIFPEIQDSKMKKLQKIVDEARLTMFYESKKKKMVIYSPYKYNFYSKFPCIESAIPEKPQQEDISNEEYI